MSDGAQIVDAIELVLSIGVVAVWMRLIWKGRSELRSRRTRIFVAGFVFLLATLLFRGLSDFLQWPAEWAVTFGAFVRGVFLISGLALMLSDRMER